MRRGSRPQHTCWYLGLTFAPWGTELPRGPSGTALLLLCPLPRTPHSLLSLNPSVPAPGISVSQSAQSLPLAQNVQARPDRGRPTVRAHAPDWVLVGSWEAPAQAPVRASPPAWGPLAGSQALLGGQRIRAWGPRASVPLPLDCFVSAVPLEGCREGTRCRRGGVRLLFCLSPFHPPNTCGHSPGPGPQSCLIPSLWARN